MKLCFISASRKLSEADWFCSFLESGILLFPESIRSLYSRAWKICMNPHKMLNRNWMLDSYRIPDEKETWSPFREWYWAQIAFNSYTTQKMYVLPLMAAVRFSFHSKEPVDRNIIVSVVQEITIMSFWTRTQWRSEIESGILFSLFLQLMYWQNWHQFWLSHDSWSVHGTRV